MKSLKMLTLFLFLVISNAYAESSAVEKYKQAYIEQITPLIKKQFAAELEKEVDPEAKLAFVANGMADCQLKTLAVFPQKYQDASINPVAEGADLGEVTQQVNEMMKKDIDNGEISKDEFKAIVETATEKYMSCTKALEKQL